MIKSTNAPTTLPYFVVFVFLLAELVQRVDSKRPTDVFFDALEADFSDEPTAQEAQFDVAHISESGAIKLVISAKIIVGPILCSQVLGLPGIAIVPLLQ